MAQGRLIIAAVASLIALGIAASALAQSGALTVPVRAEDNPSAMVVAQVPLYRSSHALVIGIDAYTGGWPRLSNAVKDATLVADELRRHGFDVTLKTDVNSGELEQAFKEFFIYRGADPEARLFVWFAGHGHTDFGEGFLVPADAPRAEAGASFRFAALSLRRFGEYVRLARSKHVYAVFDSCFSGTIFETQRSTPPRAITWATREPVRQFLSSGDAEQQVFDNGTFRDLFIRALRGEETADANRDGFVTASEIGLYLTDRVINLTRTRQTPRYGKLNDKDLDRGEFVFKAMPVATASAAAPPARTRAAPPPAPPVPAVDPDVLAWQSIMGSSNPADYRAYLEAFPEGRFVPLARVRAGTAAPPPQTAAMPRPEEPAKPPAAPSPPARQQQAATPPPATPPQTAAVPKPGEPAKPPAAPSPPARQQQATAVAPSPPATGSPAQPAVALPPPMPKPGETFQDCERCPEMVVMPAGSFEMGSLDAETAREYVVTQQAARERPRHRVTFARPFAVGKHEVTREQYERFVAETGRAAGGGCSVWTGSEWKKDLSKSWRDPGFVQPPRDPVVCVTWDDAKAYAAWLAGKTGKGYRLLSEAEWEYAARAGTTTARAWGDAIGRGQANCIGCGSLWDNWRTAPFGSFAANAFGLHDMLGNVWEWVEDCANETYDKAPADGRAWTTGECDRRALRGGSWTSASRLVRSAQRGRNVPGLRSNDVGFRVARVL